MSSEYANQNALVSTEWVAEHLHDPAVRLIEVDVDTSAYETGHIPGALGFNWTTQLADRIRRDVPDKAAWERLLGSVGVGPDTRIVYYGDNNNWFAAWAYWQLKLHGIDKVSIIDGGRKYWLDHGLPLTTEASDPAGGTITIGEPDFTTRAFREAILPRLGEPGFALVDVRSPAEFSGEVIAPPGMSETAQRGGHIPGAASIPWAQAVREDGTFKSADELRALYAGKGITPDKDVVAYCRIGERSSHTWFVLHELLGYPSVQNYDGSWTEWGNLVNAPIER